MRRKMTLNVGRDYFFRVDTRSLKSSNSKFNRKDPTSHLNEWEIVFIIPPRERQSDYWREHPINRGKIVRAHVSSAYLLEGGRIGYNAVLIE